MPKTAYQVQRPFGYNGDELDRGQLVELLGLPNDERLVRLTFVQEIIAPSEADVVICPDCGARFTREPDRRGHHQKRHGRPRLQRDGTIDPRYEDKLLDQEEKMINEVAPLPLEKTAASMKG